MSSLPNFNRMYRARVSRLTLMFVRPFQVLLHDPNEVAQVKDLGFAISPGTHTLVGIRRQLIDNLAPPYGTCQYNTTLRSHCLSQCMSNEINQKCRCRDLYMPTPTDYIHHMDQGTHSGLYLRPISTCPRPPTIFNIWTKVLTPFYISAPSLHAPPTDNIQNMKQGTHSILYLRPISTCPAHRQYPTYGPRYSLHFISPPISTCPAHR